MQMLFAGAPLPFGSANRGRFLADGVDIVVPNGVLETQQCQRKLL
jgi:hypothetical protein